MVSLVEPGGCREQQPGHDPLLALPEVDSGRPRILIAGIGNLLMSDDGVGIHAIRPWQAVPLPANILAAEVGTAFLDALHLFEWTTHLLVIDAVEAGQPPGTIYRTSLDSMATRPAQASLHDLDLLAALRLIQPKLRPAASELLGVQPARLSWGLDLSPPVAAVMPEVARQIRQIVTEWDPAADLDAGPAVYPVGACRSGKADHSLA